MRGTAVLKHGMLRGMQQHATCDVLVHMRTDGAEPQFTEGFVFGAPPSLPDGEYLVEFEGHTMRARKDQGRWMYSNDIHAQEPASQADALSPKKP